MVDFEVNELSDRVNPEVLAGNGPKWVAVGVILEIAEARGLDLRHVWRLIPHVEHPNFWERANAIWRDPAAAIKLSEHMHMLEECAWTDQEMLANAY